METTTERGKGRKPCVLCGGVTVDDVATPASTYAARGEYGIARCEGCGSGQTVPMPEMDELSAFYSKDYKYDAHLLIAEEKRWRARQILDMALPEGAKRVLDVGCMYGYLLDEARARGIETAWGVELSKGPARAAEERGHSVYCGFIEDFAKETAERFDLIVAQHVLEHVSEPSSFLRAANELLAPGGRLAVCVPNFDSRARKRFHESWGWYQVPVHLHHFGEAGLRRLLDASGFEIRKTERRGGDSLFVLTTLLQSVGRMPKSESVASPSLLAKSALRAASAMLRPYYYVGDDELLVVAASR